MNLAATVAPDDTRMHDTPQPQFLQDLLAADPEVPHFRSFPSVATRLMAACQDENSTPKTIAEIIQCDASFSLRLLRLANSAMYGFVREIRTVDQAVVILGFRSVRSLALSMAGSQMFSQGAEFKDERIALWKHSLGCATVARLIAESTGQVPADEAFLCGIFHDVGKLLLLDILPQFFPDRAESSLVMPTYEDEPATFGATHEQIGAHCAEVWGLPHTIVSAVGYHHRPEAATDHQYLVNLVRAADILSKSWRIGWTGEGEESSQHEGQSAASDLDSIPLPLEGDALGEVEDCALSEFEDAVRAFEL